MTGALAPRLVLVTRETEYEGLLARHATRGQAAAFMRRRSQAGSLEGMDTQREQLQAMLTEIRAALPRGWRVANVRRAELDRFLFGPEDVVVAVGQDGLVANVAKYLDGQPVISVNADPARNPGVLVPHTAAEAAALLARAAMGPLPTEGRTMIQAKLDDGQALLALNEVFVGHASHQSARYSVTHRGREEAQSSSGLIVASGTGATGWALSIGRATGVSVDVAPGEAAALFLVREPWPSRATGVSLASGRLEAGDTLLVASRMNEGGVVFADGMEHDRLDFAWGHTLRVSVADRQLRFVPGKARAAASRPSPLAQRPSRPAPMPRPDAAALPSGRPVPVPPAARRTATSKGRARMRLLAVLLGLGALLLLLPSAVAGLMRIVFDGAGLSWLSGWWR